jgi:hypothetical protein
VANQKSGRRRGEFSPFPHAAVDGLVKNRLLLCEDTYDQSD